MVPDCMPTSISVNIGTCLQLCMIHYWDGPATSLTPSFGRCVSYCFALTHALVGSWRVAVHSDQRRVDSAELEERVEALARLLQRLRDALKVHGEVHVQAHLRHTQPPCGGQVGWQVGPTTTTTTTTTTNNNNTGNAVLYYYYGYY